MQLLWERLLFLVSIIVSAAVVAAAAAAAEVIRVCKPTELQLKLTRVIKAVLRFRGEVLFNTIATVDFGNSSGGINEDGCRIFSTVVFGPGYDSGGALNSHGQ